MPPPDPVAATVAQQRLRTSGYAASMREVTCEAVADAVVLRGRVASFYFKQLAQEIVRKVDGACRIVNELEVEDWTRSATNGQANGKRHVRQTATPGSQRSTEATRGCADTDCG